MFVRTIAPTNIAVVKYWGKNPAWEKWNVPTKSSASWTVEKLAATTELEVKKGSGNVKFELNGKSISPQMKEYEYVGDMLGKLFELVPAAKRYDYEVVSSNNFPTAAGFASSAAGFSALARAIGGAMEKLEPKVHARYFANDARRSTMAAMGSGSASRSMPEAGGFVAWHRGLPYPKCPKPGEVGSKKMEDALFSSFSETLFAPTYWPQLRILFTMVNKGEKKTKSRAGMKTSVNTCPYYEAWVAQEESSALPHMIEAVRARDFGKFADLTMRCSDAMHGVMNATSPSIRYLNDTSLRIVEAVREMNEERVQAGYTFDAGPNAVVFCLDKDEARVQKALADILGGENIISTKPGPGARIEKVEA